MTVKRRGKRFLVGAICAAMAGIVGMLVTITFVAIPLQNRANELPRMIVPGQHTFTLNKAGTYKIYHEYETVVGARSFSNPKSLPNLQCSVVSVATGAEIALEPATTSETYEWGQRKGIALWQFTVDQPGDYTLNAVYPPGTAGPESVVAVGNSIVAAIFRVIFGTLCGMAFVFLMFATTVVFVILWFVNRINQKKAETKSDGHQERKVQA